MYLVNRFGRVVDVDDDRAQKKLDKGTMRPATESEIAGHLAHKESLGVAPGDVYYQTVRQTPDGYGMSRDHIKLQLKKLGVSLTEQYSGQKIGLLYNMPYSLISMRTDVRLIMTMFESDKLPEEWPEYLKAADEVIVPSKWCHDVFLKAGIQSTVVPLGYNDDAFKFIDRPVPEGDEPFTFIHYDSFNLRKGFMEVFNAFTQEFKPEENVKLILKTVRQNTGIPLVRSQFPQIEVVRGVLDESELQDLLARAHCMVYPSRGEGFGITPLEAMATGLPAIVPNAHGISEYFNNNYMLEVRVGGKCPGLYSKFKGQDVGEMVICDVDDLRKQMRYAFEHREEMKELGRAASEYVKSYTYKHSAERLAGIIKHWKNTEVVKRGDSKYLQVERL